VRLSWPLFRPVAGLNPERLSNGPALCPWAFVANFPVYLSDFFSQGCKPFLFFVRLTKVEIIAGGKGGDRNE